MYVTLCMAYTLPLHDITSRITCKTTCKATYQFIPYEVEKKTESQFVILRKHFSKQKSKATYKDEISHYLDKDCGWYNSCTTLFV